MSKSENTEQKCISYVLIAANEISHQKQLLEGKSLIWLIVPKIESILSGKSWHELGACCHIWRQVAKNELQMKPGYNTSRPAPSGPLPPAKLHLPNIVPFPNSTKPTGIRYPHFYVFKHISLE